MSRAGVWLVLLVLQAVPSGAQPPECEPLSPAGIVIVSSRLGLEDDQVQWLQARLAGGRLGDPADLEDLPGLDTELRDLLEGAWCWDASPARPVAAPQVSLAARKRALASRRDARLDWETRFMSGRLRIRAEDPGGRTLRGGAGFHRNGWFLVAGTLRRRSGLGLLVATPGAEPRGDVPLRADVGGWRASTALEPEIAQGIGMGHAARTWQADVAFVRGVDGDWGLASATRELGAQLRLGLDATLAREGGGAGMRLSGGAAERQWRVELAAAGGGTAAGGAWRFRRGAVRLGASVILEGGGFVSAARRWPSEVPRDSGWQWAVDARWQGGPGRFMALGILDRLRPDGGPDWPDVRRQLVIDIGERIRPGVTALLRWRLRRTGPAGFGAPVRDGLARGELRVQSAGWRARFRLEERTEAARRAHVLGLHWGREGRFSWEIRVVRLQGEPEIRVWWHRRRAGGQYGWDALGPGTWIGAWMARRTGVFRFQVSGDAHPVGWEVTVSVEWRPGA